MWRLFVADACIALAVILLWYCWFRVWLLHRTREVLRWIGCALERHGKITGVRPLGGSRFQVNLRLDSNLFHSPALIVQLAPRQWPLNWLWHFVTRRDETVTFQANLESRPVASLEVTNQRWCPQRPSRKSRRNPGKTFTTHNVGALVMTTREHWEFNSMVDALLLSRSNDFLHVSIRRKSPHLRATVALDTLRPGAHHSNMFDVLRELAAGASTSA